MACLLAYLLRRINPKHQDQSTVNPTPRSCQGRHTPSQIVQVPDRDNLTQRVIGPAVRVHTLQSPGLLESAYEHGRCHEFDQHALPRANSM